MLITLFITSARPVYFYFFFFNDTATTEIYTLSLHDALPISIKQVRAFTLKGGGADYHDQSDGHWIDDHIATPDRKSTRLNSSHSQISYAVFCLKKKKNTVRYKGALIYYGETRLQNILQPVDA